MQNKIRASPHPKLKSLIALIVSDMIIREVFAFVKRYM